MKLLAPGERIKLGLLSLLLLLMLGLVCFAAVSTYESVRNFQRQNSALAAGDVSTIRAWMTIHVVARLYHVPEDYLSQELAVGNPEQIRHFTLNQIASSKKQSVSKLIQTVQHAILDYRKTHHTQGKTPPLKQKPPRQRTTIRPRPVKPVSKLILHGGTESRLLTARRT
ncbi:MAG TPA: hypothetical protein VIZ18_18010 [Ktedonobacteraceae bacterium]